MRYLYSYVKFRGVIRVEVQGDPPGNIRGNLSGGKNLEKKEGVGKPPDINLSRQ